jgi:hypothetical protein
MTSAMTVTSEHSGQALTRAVDGEKAGMDSGPAPLGPILEEIVKRAELAKDGVWNHINWSGELSMAAGGTLTSFTLTVGAINALVLYNGTRYKTFAYAGGTITQTKIEGGGGTLGASAKIWFVYAFDNAGSLDFQISDTVPAANRRNKNSDTKYVYLGWFCTDSTGAPLPMIRRGNTTRFLFGAIASTGAHRVITGGNATSFTAVTVSCVPTHARLIRLHFELTPGAAGRAVYYRAGGTSTFHKYFMAQATYAVLGDTSVELDSSRQFEYKVSNSGDSLETYVTEVEE